MAEGEGRAALSASIAPKGAHGDENAAKSRHYVGGVTVPGARVIALPEWCMLAHRPWCPAPGRPRRVVCDLPAQVGFTRPAALEFLP